MGNSGIIYTIVYKHMAAVFPYFSVKRQQRGKFIKCAEVRTKKVYRKCGMLQKVAQKRAVMYFGKFEKVRAKKEFCNTVYARGKCHKMPTKKEFLYTICAGAKNLDFPGRIELVYTITRAWGNHQKLTLKNA